MLPVWACVEFGDPWEMNASAEYKVRNSPSKPPSGQVMLLLH